LSEESRKTQAMIDRERAGQYQRQANDGREERSKLIEERQRREREEMAGKLPSLADSVQRGEASNTARKAEDDHHHAGREDKDAEPEEMTDAKQAKAAKREATKAAYAQFREERKDKGRDKGGGRDI